MGDLVLAQPPRGVFEHPVKGLERLFDRLSMVGSVTGQPHRHRDDVFSDIDCRAALIKNQHRLATFPVAP